MSACNVPEPFGPVTVGTTKLSTKIVITVANMPSVRASVLSFRNQEETFSLIYQRSKKSFNLKIGDSDNRKILNFSLMKLTFQACRHIRSHEQSTFSYSLINRIIGTEN